MALLGDEIRVLVASSPVFQPSELKFQDTLQFLVRGPSAAALFSTASF